VKNREKVNLRHRGNKGKPVFVLKKKLKKGSEHKKVKKKSRGEAEVQ